MAKDTEKLIRQLSLISYLMAERRPVTATEIRRDVEGYSDMTEDAFARRFYADRAELDALGIHLSVDKPTDGFSEQENYSLAPEAFHLPPIAFTDAERAALQTALTLLDGEFAYAEPLRLALQQITWGRPSPLGSDSRQTIGLGITASAGGGETSARLAKIDTAIYRRKRIEFEYHTMGRDATEQRKVDPYHLLFEGGQFYLVGWSHERKDVREFRLSRIRGKVAYATKAEHDFQRPEDFDPRLYANRIPWQLGDTKGTAELEIPENLEWYIERQYGDYGTLENGVYKTDYSIARLLISWALEFGLRIVGPPELVQDARERVDKLIEDHRGEAPAVVPSRAPAVPVPVESNGRSRGGDAAIRPERFARLVTLATVLISAGKAGETLLVGDVCEQLQLSPTELREDIAVLNVVNFGGGAYVIYAEVKPTGEIEVDPEPYSDTFDRPARLLPIEAKALVAAIDLIGLAQADLRSGRSKVVDALGFDPVEEGLHIVSPKVDDDIMHRAEIAIQEHRLLELEYWTQSQDRYSERVVEPYGRINSREGWYIAAWDRSRGRLIHFRLDRIKTAQVLDETFEPNSELDVAADIGGWPRTGRIGGSRSARVHVGAEQARWAREQRPVLTEVEGGAVVVEITFKGLDFLVREVLKEAGDAVVLEPADAREAVLDAAEKLVARAT
ncbi:WYL domain-containing protein [Solirubrobacter phytolaccae]|uniref:WYL domain-containing protein n=1 Tax=Solirubrobacter phytolaccae TaxID=1404360 RepID=A0A9X3N7C3_9ACTN|nr:WYL domain-containing protein [Solirubrobacter phytolaccae]MDA0179081.1 WYL domain-containing protein [Solirubrobacter phytolaccae]